MSGAGEDRDGEQKVRKALEGAACTLHVRYAARGAALSGTLSTWNALRPFSALGSCS
jgi:hypothetical protein